MLPLLPQQGQRNRIALLWYNAVKITFFNFFFLDCSELNSFGNR